MLSSVYSFNSFAIAEEKQNSIIKLGMEFEEAEKILKEFKAIEAYLSITSPSDSTIITKSYSIPNIKPYIIINYSDQHIIEGLTLYYEYQHKGHPDNKWLNVDEIDFKNIAP